MLYSSSTDLVQDTEGTCTEMKLRYVNTERDHFLCSLWIDVGWYMHRDSAAMCWYEMMSRAIELMILFWNGHALHVHVPTSKTAIGAEMSSANVPIGHRVVERCC